MYYPPVDLFGGTEMTDFIASERLYLTKDGQVVGEKHPDRLTLLIASGQSMPRERAISYGLVTEDGQIIEREADIEIDENQTTNAQSVDEDEQPVNRRGRKAVAGAPENKMQSLTENKATEEDQA